MIHRVRSVPPIPQTSIVIPKVQLSMPIPPFLLSKSRPAFCPPLRAVPLTACLLTGTPPGVKRKSPGGRSPRWPENGIPRGRIPGEEALGLHPPPRPAPGFLLTIFGRLRMGELIPHPAPEEVRRHRHRRRGKPSEQPGDRHRRGDRLALLRGLLSAPRKEERP